MQYINVQISHGDTISTTTRKVRFVVKIDATSEEILCVNAEQVSAVLKKKTGKNYSVSDIYNWTNPVRRRLKLIKRGFGDGFSIKKIPRNPTRQEIKDERERLRKIKEASEGSGEAGGEQDSQRTRGVCGGPGEGTVGCKIIPPMEG